MGAQGARDEHDDIRTLVGGLPPTLIRLLRCPFCYSQLTLESDPVLNESQLKCSRCSQVFPIVDRIPRFVRVASDETARRTQESFGYEWTHFNNWRYSGQTNFEDYFQGVDLAGLKEKVVLDAGCGMGRHAREMARFANQVVALDFSRAIDQAARNTVDLKNVDCVQADLLNLPFPDATFDYVYSLGVLHHLEDTDRAIAGLVRTLKPGGRLRIYLYWKRTGWPGRVLAAVAVVRRLTIRMPFSVLKLACYFLSIFLFGGVIVPYRVLSALNVHVHEDWPLFVYAKYPFNVLYNDQFDRFSAPLEKRYDSQEVTDLLEAAGLRDVRVLRCFGWIGEGVRVD
jgi:SAM-dependent methyltransferase